MCNEYCYYWNSRKFIKINYNLPNDVFGAVWVNVGLNILFDFDLRLCELFEFDGYVLRLPVLTVIGKFYGYKTTFDFDSINIKFILFFSLLNMYILNLIFHFCAENFSLKINTGTFDFDVIYQCKRICLCVSVLFTALVFLLCIEVDSSKYNTTPHSIDI